MKLLEYEAKEIFAKYGIPTAASCVVNDADAAAAFIASGGFTKPVAAYIAGRAAVPGKRMGHAGAIISGGAGTAQGKMDALRKAGAAIGERPIEVAEHLKRILG